MTSWTALIPWCQLCDMCFNSRRFIGQAKRCVFGTGRRKRVWFLLVLLIVFVYIDLMVPVRYMFKNSNVKSACVIPRLDPFHPSVMQFMWKPSPLVCDGSSAVVFVDAQGYLQYNQSALTSLRVDTSQLGCQYRTIIRNSDDYTIHYTKFISFTPPVHLDDDFIEVVCLKDRKQVLFQRVLTNIGKRSKQQQVLPESEDHLSVLVFGVDSVSRSHSIRKLPKTTAYLKDVLHSYDLHGHMKVGENTLPNLTPLLTGKRIWSSEVPISNYNTDRVDDLPFLWRNYSQNNYATFHAEDMVKFGTFQYEARGFEKQPTDHYMRPFYLALQEPSMVSNVVSDVLLFLEDKKVKLNKGSALCYGDKPKHEVQIDYLKQFIQKYKNKRKFAFSFLSELVHEYPNFLEYGEDSFLDFIKWLKNEGHLDNMVLIFFSDHGNRIEKIRNTLVGRIEDRMPVVHIVIPEHVKARTPHLHEIMQENTQRLSTNFDIHQTLIDVLLNNFNKPTESYINGTLRGISLFRPLPKDRTCADAWIPENYCACYTSSSVNISSNAIVKPLAAKLVLDLNSALAVAPQCARLELHEVREVQVLSSGLHHYSTEGKTLTLYSFFHPVKHDDIRYFISITTVPGYGIFEASYDVNETGSYKLIETIDRTNKYGNQSSCIHDVKLRTFCFCKDQL